MLKERGPRTDDYAGYLLTGSRPFFFGDQDMIDQPQFAPNAGSEATRSAPS